MRKITAGFLAAVMMIALSPAAATRAAEVILGTENFENVSQTGAQYQFSPDSNSVFKVVSGIGAANVKEVSVVDVNGSKKAQLAYADGGSTSAVYLQTNAVSYDTSTPLAIQYKMTLHNLEYSTDGVTLGVYAYNGSKSEWITILNIKNNRVPTTSTTAFTYEAGTMEDEKLEGSNFTFNEDQEYTMLFVMSGSNKMSVYVDGKLLSDKMILKNSGYYNATVSFRLNSVYVSTRKATFDETGAPNNNYGRVYLDDVKVFTPDTPSFTEGDWDFYALGESPNGGATDYAITATYNGNESAVNLTFIAAAYDADGNLAALDIDSAAGIGRGDINSLTAAVAKPSGGSVKVMLWSDLSGLTPLLPPFER